ncbi:MAG: hypothetical protein IPJ69_11235 [Deltaproteobacteria bacterium]|nr:MAG: hypothetical protein IPJ69_11235 [Deltaproteobacteria bacterium]
MSPNVISQDFTAKTENQKWGCDISYIETKEGWLYLAIVMDFFSRKIVGFDKGFLCRLIYAVEHWRKHFL